MTETLAPPTETLFPDPPAPGPGGFDILSDILRVFRVEGAALLRGVFTAPWAVETPPASTMASLLHPGAKRMIIFHIIAEGSCWIEMEGVERRFLRQGDIVGIPHGHAHRIGSGSGPVVPIDALFPPLPWTELPVLELGGDGARTHIVCTYLHCDISLFSPFLASLPPLLVVPGDRGAADHWFAANLHYLVGEVMRGRPGSSCLTARLTELLFIEILRLHMAELQDEAVGWLAALRDRRMSRALSAFHSRPGDAWSVAGLAREAGLSRSALVRRFHGLLNMSPMRYLTTWRLHLAAEALRERRDTVADIAERVGYGSEEAFSRAFKRGFGVSPAVWRQTPS